MQIKKKIFMRTKMLIFAVFMCFVAASGFAKGKKEPSPPKPSRDIEADIAKLLEAQKNTSDQLTEMGRKLDRIEQEGSEWHRQPPRTPNPPPNPPPVSGSPAGTRRPSISGDLPVIAKSGQSNYLEKSAIVEYFYKVRGIPRSIIDAIIGYYIDEAKLLDINHDIAIAQMCHATVFLTNNLLETRNYANFNKDGAIWQSKSWNGIFPNSRTGVRAHIQHLKGYASTGCLEGEIVDPRFHKLEGLRGKGDTLHKLCGLWVGHGFERARTYENNLRKILEDLYGFQEGYK
jgi:hypothetical protein